MRMIYSSNGKHGKKRIANQTIEPTSRQTLLRHVGLISQFPGRGHSLLLVMTQEWIQRTMTRSAWLQSTGTVTWWRVPPPTDSATKSLGERCSVGLVGLCDVSNHEWCFAGASVIPLSQEPEHTLMTQLAERLPRETVTSWWDFYQHIRLMLFTTWLDYSLI